MRSVRFTKKILTVTSVGVLAVAAIFLGVFMNSRTSDASVAGWKAGNIMTDSVFTNKSTMSVSRIQAFLNSKVPSCDTWGTQTSEFGGGTRRQWAEAHGYSAPFTCLRNYSQGGKSAAQIIYNTAQKYTINPQVLLVLLQKEQGLVTDTWPLSIQYRSATGYGCPDHAACDSDYYGFANQVDWAAKMFRAILNDSPTWFTPYELGNNYIQYNPESSCGGSNVYIQNRATQALYNYTPYQPNAGALNAGWGTAQCGSYGNRNFYLYFTSWFGSTRTNFTSLDTPRWMQAAGNVYKKDPASGDATGGQIADNTQLRIVDKISIGGKWYFRTDYDSNNDLYKGMLSTDLEEIPFETITPRYVVLTKPASKYNPRSFGKYKSSAQKVGTTLKITSRIQVNGQWFYRTEYDTQHGKIAGIYAQSTGTPQYVNFEEPRYLRTNGDVKKVDPITGTQNSTVIPKNTQLRFTSKILIDGKWYYRTDADTTSDAALAIPSSSIEEIPFTALPSKTWMRVKTARQKVDPATGTLRGGQIPVDTRLQVSHSAVINGVTYYKTTYDASMGIKRAMPASALEEQAYVSITPKDMRLTESANKQIPGGAEYAGTIKKDTRLRFSSRISIGGKWYYRTDYDTAHDLDKSISEDHLADL